MDRASMSKRFLACLNSLVGDVLNILCSLNMQGSGSEVHHQSLLRVRRSVTITEIIALPLYSFLFLILAALIFTSVYEIHIVHLHISKDLGQKGMFS